MQISQTCMYCSKQYCTAMLFLKIKWERTFDSLIIQYRRTLLSHFTYRPHHLVPPPCQTQRGTLRLSAKWQSPLRRTGPAAVALLRAHLVRIASNYRSSKRATKSWWPWADACMTWRLWSFRPAISQRAFCVRGGIRASSVTKSPTGGINQRSMLSIGAYNALETAIVTFNVFDKYRGLYFWSMQIASWGIVLHSISAMVRFVNQASGLAMSIPFLFGWYAIVTGQAIVLYSRLHLVVLNKYTVRWALWMIIINAVVLHIPMGILFLGVGQGNSHFTRAAAIYDRIQLTAFCIQDLVLCGTYIRSAVRIMKPIMALRDCTERRIIIHLALVNAFVLVLNLLLLIAEYKFHFIQISLKTVVYSIKLKLEFTVLNRLRSLIKSRPYTGQGISASGEFARHNRFSDTISSQASVSRMVRHSAPFLDVKIPSPALWLDANMRLSKELPEEHANRPSKEQPFASVGPAGGEGWVRGPTGKLTEDLDCQLDSRDKGHVSSGWLGAEFFQRNRFLTWLHLERSAQKSHIQKVEGKIRHTDDFGYMYCRFRQCKVRCQPGWFSWGVNIPWSDLSTTLSQDDSLKTSCHYLMALPKLGLDACIFVSLWVY